MKTIRDIDTFEELTGFIFSVSTLKELGIPSVFADAAFSRRELPRLQEFCARNEGFHIISRLAGKVMVNYFDPRAFLYHLGNGSTDPSLCYFDPSPFKPRSWKTFEHLHLLLLPPAP